MRILDRFPDPAYDPVVNPGTEVAVLGGGCFWCTEGVFQQIPGVLSIKPGYAGGDPARATYKDVCDGDTGHVEVIEITFDPAQITYGQILKNFFWLAHDPTQSDGQGADIGPQYRSTIFYADDRQHIIAKAYIEQIDKAELYGAPIATKLEPLEKFYEAEEYHHNYAQLNPGQPYIQSVAAPKITRAQAVFGKKTAA